MTHHIGHDHLNKFRFRITEMDTDTQIVAIQYEETAWSPGNTLTDRLTFTEFLEELMQGHFEIRPAGEQSGKAHGAQL